MCLLQEDILRLWQKAIPTYGSSLQKHHHVCELHFKPEEVNKIFIHVVPDGIYTLPKDRCSLRKGSVPSIFPTVQTESNAQDQSAPLRCFVEDNKLPVAAPSQYSTTIIIIRFYF